MALTSGCDPIKAQSSHYWMLMMSAGVFDESDLGCHQAEPELGHT